MNQRELDVRFSYHMIQGNQADRMEFIRETCKTLARDLDEICPQSRELALAHTHLEEVMMWANAAIARRESDMAGNPISSEESASREAPPAGDEIPPLFGNEEIPRTRHDRTASLRFSARYGGWYEE